MATIKETDIEDVYGQTVAYTVKSRELTDIHEQLFTAAGGYGYKFAIIFDVSGELAPNDSNEHYIYYLDNVLSETLSYSDITTYQSGGRWYDQSGARIQPQDGIIRCKDCAKQLRHDCPMCVIENKTLTFIEQRDDFFCGAAERKET